MSLFVSYVVTSKGNMHNHHDFGDCIVPGGLIPRFTPTTLDDIQKIKTYILENKGLNEEHYAITIISFQSFQKM